MRVRLSTSIANINIRNPIVLASGPYGSTGIGLKGAALAGAGAVISKSITFEPRKGNPRPWIIKLPYGLMNSTGLANMGYKRFIKEIKIAKEGGVPVIVSVVAGPSVEKTVDMATEFEQVGADMLELPLVTYFRRFKVEQIIIPVKKAVDIPVAVKLASSPDIARMAKRVERAGADAITAIDAVGPGMVIDVNDGRPVIGNPAGTGLISGSAIKSIAIRCVADIARTVNLPIMGVGGISRGEDAIEMMMAGANAVQICTAVELGGLRVFTKIISEMEEYLKSKGYKDVNEIIKISLKYLPKLDISRGDYAFTDKNF